MHGLEKGINQLASHEMNQTVRKNAISQLNGVIDDINAGIEVWENFSRSGGASVEPGAFGGWAGFTIEKQLFEMELDARDKARQASNGSSSLDEPLVELAYSKLGESQSVDEHCKAAIDKMKNRINKINGLIDLIKNTKPKKLSTGSAAAPAKKPAKKSAVKKKKAAKKKAVKKKAAKKKAAKKKVGKKKAAKKKASKKKATKKKAAKKKATKKKATKKKATKKKATKKKATKKKATKKKAARKKKAKTKKVRRR